MPSSGKRRPNYGRRFAWLGGLVVLLVIAYSGAWLWLAAELERQSARLLSELRQEGIEADCANGRARGFPFRLGLWCDSVAFADPAAGVGISAGAFRSAGQIYDPLRLIAELDGPAEIEVDGERALSLAWDQLRASARLSRPLPRRVSVEGRELGVALPTGVLLASAKAFQGHMRPNGADLDLAASADGFVLGRSLVQGRALPPLNGRADISIADGVAKLLAGTAELRGSSATVRTLSLASGPDARIDVSGTVSVGEDGLLDASLTLRLVSPDKIAALVAEAFPEYAETIRAAFSGVAELGAEPTMPLTVVDGHAALGFVPLGELPPL